MSVIKYDKVILKKELGDRLRMVGQEFEIANITEGNYLLRDAKTKVAIATVSFAEFKEYFEKPEKMVEWTPWTQFATDDEYNLKMFYRVRGTHKVQVRTSDGYIGEACCNRRYGDEFNLYHGLNLAYLRCLRKVLLDKADYHQKEVKKYTNEVSDIESGIDEVIKRL